MSESQFVLGPYVTRHGDGSRISEGVTDTGCILEFATQAEAHALNIFHCPGYFHESRDFGTYAVREIQMPFGIQCFGFQVKDFPGGPYVTLSAFLAEMYALYEHLTPIARFFEHFGEILSVQDSFSDSGDISDYPLKQNIEAIGYRVRSVISWGRHIDLEIAWVFPQSRTETRTRRFIHAATAKFRPKPDRTLDKGKWVPHRKHFVESLLGIPLMKLGYEPVSILQEVAKSKLLDGFPWTPLARMTNQEAREARISFVRDHCELASDPKILALSLKNAGLYSGETSVSQIRKFLPSLLMAAGLSV